MRGFAFVLLLACTPVPRAEVVKAEHPHAEALAVLEGDAREAFVLLADAGSFTSAHVGAHGGLSRYVAALRLLVRHPDSQVAVGALWQSENRVARLYALAGFWYLRPGEYREALASLRGDETSIETQSGCSIYARTVASVLGDPDDDALIPGTGRSDARCAGRSRGYTMHSGRVPIALIEGERTDFNLCSRPSEEWPRLTLPAAWPDAELERLLQRQRDRADLSPPPPTSREAMDELLDQVARGGAVVPHP